ncbi:MAG: YcjX family protein [Magnetococcales bacterium]|nr:YcjX family protein [Magnetococcales bacterium]
MIDWPIDTLVNNAKRTLDDLVHLAMDRTVRLAVTGLNHSGKTVFITSLVHQLLNGPRSGGLNFFSVVKENRLRGSKVVLQPDMDVAAFRYEDFIEPLTGSGPTWPKATDGLSEIRLALRFQPTGLIHQHLTNAPTLYLDIIDYPGEWLLDLPMLGMNFADWSNSIFKLCEGEPRQTLSQEWRQFITDLDRSRPPNEGTLRRAAKLYTEFLHACRKNDAGLSFLQPGRFFVPGELMGAPLLTFCPLDGNDGADAPGSLYQVMAERFEFYKEHVVGKFYKQHFSQFDRQIVLVDVLKALNNGPDHFRDMQHALDSILNSFDYGQSGLLSRLFNPKIDKLLFASTKADHVAANQHHNLERLVNRLVVKPANEALFQGVEVKTMALSSVVCTETVVREHHGRRLSFVKGVPKGRKKEILLFPGEIPESLPKPSDWENNRFNFQEFKPKPMADLQDGALPHMRLDQVLEFLLGDKLS